ncbi:hypothetical protein D3C76_1781520 [compost metagenome]
MWLDTFGTDKEFLGNSLVKTSEGWELVAKGESEWRFPISVTYEESTPNFELISYYKK